jgi:hypothetical protein
MTEASDTTERFIRPFSDWVEDQREGALNGELSLGLNTLVESVKTTGKAGTITLKITVKPAGKETHDAVVVSDVVTIKKPESRAESFFFVDGEANLTRNNPRQLGYDGPLLEVPERGAGAPVKDVRS